MQASLAPGTRSSIFKPSLGRAPPTSYFHLIVGKAKHGDTIFASVRAGDVSRYNSLLLNRVAMGESPGDPGHEVGGSHLADSQTYLLLVILRYPLNHVVA